MGEYDKIICNLGFADNGGLMDIKNHFSTLKDQGLKKRLFNIILFVVYPAYLLHSCVVSPLYTVFDSNVETELLSLVFYALYNFIDIAVIFLSCAVIIYGIYRLSLKEIKKAYAFVLVAPVFKYVLKLIVSPIVDGIVDLEQILMDLYSIGVSCVLEILQLWIIIYVARAYIEKHKSVQSVIAKASSRMGEAKPDASAVPFKKIFDIKNPLQRGAFTSALIVTAVRILMLAIHDISNSISALDFGGVLVILGAYVIELSVGVFGYLAMLYIFISIATKDQ